MGLDISLDQIVKPTEKLIKSVTEGKAMYHTFPNGKKAEIDFVTLNYMLQTVTGRQVINKYGHLLAMAGVRYVDYPALGRLAGVPEKKLSTIYNGSSCAGMRKVKDLLKSSKPVYHEIKSKKCIAHLEFGREELASCKKEDIYVEENVYYFEPRKGTEKLFIVTTYGNATPPIRIDHELGFFICEREYLQRKGISGFTKAHPDFQDYVKFGLIFPTTDEHLKVIKEQVRKDYAKNCPGTNPPETPLMKLRKIPANCFIRFWG